MQGGGKKRGETPEDMRKGRLRHRHTHHIHKGPVCRLESAGGLCCIHYIQQCLLSTAPVSPVILSSESETEVEGQRVRRKGSPLEGPLCVNDTFVCII